MTAYGENAPAPRAVARTTAKESAPCSGRPAAAAPERRGDRRPNGPQRRQAPSAENTALPEDQGALPPFSSPYIFDSIDRVISVGIRQDLQDPAARPKEALMPKLSGVPIAQRRALNRLQMSGAVPAPALRLKPGQWVRTLRVAFHMTQRQLAARAGVSQGNLALIEAGRFEPQLPTLRRLFDALYCDLIVLPSPRKPVSAVIAEKTLGIPTRRMWDRTPHSSAP